MSAALRMRHRRLSRPAPQWELDAAITVVLFAGRGGACDGLEEAGCPVHVANNHSDVALAAHAAIHPATRHVRGDVFDVDPIEATRGRPVKILWASPDCRDHSVAKGGAPRSARVRSLPWQVCRWMGKTRPRLVMVENVREIRGWGPLVAKRDRATGRVIKLDGSIAAPGERVPLREQQLVRDKRRLGRSYRAFVRHIEGLGYAFEARDLCCADYGVPTSRRRWFAVARSDNQPIRWPIITHAPRSIARARGLLPWVGAHTIIDWSLPIPSIFERAKPLADATHKRIAYGLGKFVLDNPQPFLLPITHSGAPRAHSLDDPLRTITTAHRGEMAVIAPHLSACGGRAGQTPPTDMRDPVGTITTKGDRCVAAGYLIQTGYGERSGQLPRVLDQAEPLSTVVAGGSKVGVVAAWVAQHNLGAIGVSMHDPLSTLTTRGTQQQVVTATLKHGDHSDRVATFMIKYYSSGSQAQDIARPLDALTSKARFGIVTVGLAGQSYTITDIGMRMLEPHEAAAAHELAMPDWIEIDGTRRRPTKTEKMHLIGNSVPKRMARLLAEANCAHSLTTTHRSTAA